MPHCNWQMQPKDMFANGLQHMILPSEARQSFAHHIDHRLRSPAIASIVEERKRQNLAVDGSYVARERDNVVRGAGFRVKISLGWRVPHPSFEELGIPCHR